MIISAYYATGKTCLANTDGKYVELEEITSKQGYHILVDYRAKILEKLEGLKFLVVIPDKNLKSEYLTRFIKRDDNPKWIETEMKNWDKTIESVILNSQEYLGDVV